MFGEIIEQFRSEFNIDRRITVFIPEICSDNGKLFVNGIIQSSDLHRKFIAFIKQNSTKEIVDTIEIVSDVKSNQMGLVRVSVSNLHKEPSFTSPVVTQALMGTPVFIIKRQKDWMLVQLPDKYLGWTSETVQPISFEQYLHWKNSLKVIVTKFTSIVYDYYDMKRVVSDTVAGNIFIVNRHEDDLIEIEYPDHRKGIIRRNFVQFFSDWCQECNSTEDAVIATTKQFIGTPYFWGGVSSKAVDCSGFVKLVYFLSGIILPRDADQQVMEGTMVRFDNSMENVKPGDLLFFGRKGPDYEVTPISHVGISLGGKRYIQSSGDVHYSSFNPEDKDYDERRSQSLIQIRRIIGESCAEKFRVNQNKMYF